MKKTVWIGSLLLAALGHAAPAQALDGAAGKTLPGHYYLQGMTEVGSELLLAEDGKFEWMLSYGAVDQSAKGRWEVDGDKVVLVATPRPDKMAFRLFTEEELNIRKPAGKGAWVAIVGVPRVGPVQDIEVIFESKSGQTKTAVTDRNGDAIVKMPASEQWARAGLRRAQAKGEWQWLAIPPARSKDNIAAIAVNESDLRAPPFERLQLRLEQGGLEVSDPDSGLRGVYSKQ
ncbi:hypothetical protein ACFDR9_005563 [Janthinobacterium sp. CG_23.3]|uniref:hypothetical protein n=1 Tax=Janthinobacterium sp. CG_23.3 TaxID=3349634 RepID=UPI0038D48D41